MPYRRMATRTFVPRKKARYLWVRETVNMIGAAPLNNFDLLSNFRQAQGITLNLPDIVIWRIILKISIRLDVGLSVPANTGAMVALFVDDTELNLAQNPVTAPYSQQYLMWDTLYSAQQILNSGSAVAAGPTLPVLYNQYDIKSHRKLRNIDQTLHMQVAAQGSAVLHEISHTASILLRLP